MSINWGLLQTGNPGNAFMAGMENGREMARARQTENALAAYAQNPADRAAENALLALAPQVGMKLREDRRAQEKRAAVGSVFSAPTVPSTPPIAPSQPGMQAPGQLMAPDQLPPRTDGLQVNQQALAALYQTDPESAIEVQKIVFNATKQQAEQFAKNGEIMQSAAYRLSQLPPQQRAAELQAMLPQLVGLGIPPEQIARTDLTDAGLERVMTLGRSIKELIADDTAKYVAVPQGSDLINVRDPQAVRQYQQQGGAPARPMSKAEYDALPPGASYTAPDGSARVKGGAAPQAPGPFPTR